AHYRVAELKKSQPELFNQLNVIGGIEISTQFTNREIHIVGLGIDVHHPTLVRFVEQQQADRRQRLSEYAAKLEGLGCRGVTDAVNSLSAESVTRTHLGQIIVELGYAQDAQRAFKKWIGRKGRAYVATEWPTIERAVDVIEQAGGVAVLAHPGRYQLNRKQLKLLLDEFTESGGQAIELSHPNINEVLNRWLIEQAKQHGLYASQGSDFHSPEWRWVKPGYFPSLSKSITPVWQQWPKLIGQS
ncbi:MAG: PHP domain-containing protein, partial [Kangiellaceae bacterium]|nr:PHP domain-containing protein [Kangiellaceae bacterium]